MIINIETGTTYEVSREISPQFDKVESGFNKDTFFQNTVNGMWGRKSNIEIDYGTYKRVIWFDNEQELGDFISKNLPINQGFIVTKKITI